MLFFKWSKSCCSAFSERTIEKALNFLYSSRPFCVHCLLNVFNLRSKLFFQFQSNALSHVCKPLKYLQYSFRWLNFLHYIVFGLNDCHQSFRWVTLVLLRVFLDQLPAMGCHFELHVKRWQWNWCNLSPRKRPGGVVRHEALEECWHSTSGSSVLGATWGPRHRILTRCLCSTAWLDIAVHCSEEIFLESNHLRHLAMLVERGLAHQRWRWWLEACCYFQQVCCCRCSCATPTIQVVQS